MENGLVNLVNRMPKDRYRHAIVCLAGFNPGFLTRIRRADVEIRTLDKRPGKDVGVYARMWLALRSLRPDIVHTRNLGTIDMQWVAAAARTPHRVHGEHGWEASDPTGRRRKTLWIRRACRPVIHRYVPMSQDIARWLERDVRVDPSRIRQLYSGVDTERFAPGLAPSSTDTKGPGTGLTIGTIGRLDPVKDQAALLRAFAALQRRVPDARLVIVGDGPLRGTLRTLATSLGIADAVTFTGARDDTPDLLRAMDVFVLPSVNEGISNTILEAMATGLPVVARRVGGNPELVLDGATGVLYDDRADPQGLEAALARYLTNPGLRQAHGRAARERAVQCFSLDAMVKRYLALYDELLCSASPHTRGERTGARG